MIKNSISILEKVINVYISYKQNPQLRNLNIDFTLNNCFFGPVKLTKNANIDKYKYSDYLIGFDSRSEFLFTDGRFRKNIIVFGAAMSSFLHIDNKNEDILILVEGPTQGLGDTTLITEAKYPIKFTQSGKKICIKSTFSYLLRLQKYINSKQKFLK